jgi:hypothetical protein
MAFAQNGAAIIDGMIVPPAEVKVLKAVVEMGRPATVPELATALDDQFSDASLYTLLGRLADKRRLVARQDLLVEVHGTKLRRVVWSAHQAAALALTEPPNGAFANPAPGGNAGNPA